MGLGQYVYPRFAVHIASGQVVPIDRLRARCLWYPAVGLDGRMVSGHVLYISQALNEALELALGMHSPYDWNAEGEAEGGEEGVSHRLAPPIRASAHASVPQLIKAIVEYTKQALPPGKRRLLSTLSGLAPADTLLRLEELLQHSGLHVLVPLFIGNQYQLFTDATEALMPVSPLNLRRTPRLCFALLSTDSLKNERRDSPWLRQAAELMALPVQVVYTPEVTRFIDELPALRPALADSQLIAELLTTLDELTGGWPDLCDRFYEMLNQLSDVAALRQRLRELATMLRCAVLESAGPTRSEALNTLFDIAFPGRSPLPDANLIATGAAPRPSASSPGLSNTRDTLMSLLTAPAAFTWEEHGRGYLEGLIGWDRGLAVPRSHAIELLLRRTVESLPAARSSDLHAPISSPGIAHSPSQSFAIPALHSPRSVRWLHLSDFHFSEKAQLQGAGIVLESLLNTLTDMQRHGRGVDLVFITGDIAYSGSAAEYGLAEAFLARLCTTLSLPRSAVLMVPGNHDADRRRGAQLSRTLGSHDDALAYFQPSAERLHLRKLEAWCAFYNRFYAANHSGSEPPRQVAPGHATAAAETLRVRDVTLGILPLNSALFAQDDADSGKLFVGEPLLREGLKRIATAQLRIALIHHPFSYLSEVEQRLIKELLQQNCHFLLRGHLHDNEAEWLASPYKHMLSLAAGAAFQSRIGLRNRALFVEVELDASGRSCRVSPYPIRYEDTGHDRWTLDTAVFPKSYPSYLETLSLILG